MSESEIPVDVVELQKQVQELVDKLKQKDDEVAALAASKNELLDEKKKETKARREAQDKLDAEEKEKEKASGNWENLLKRETERAEAAERGKKEIEDKFKQKEVEAVSMLIANELKGRPESIPLLAGEIAKEIKTLVDDNGVLAESTKAAVINKFQTTEMYKPLLMGNQSSGGGAEGVSGSAGKSLKDMTEAEQLALYNKDPNKWRALKAAS